MLYVAYKENGQFDGFYTEDIHGENIPKQSLKITEDLWAELLKDNYKYKLNLTEDKILNLSDKDTYFEKVEVKIIAIPQLPNAQELLTQQVTNLTIENKKKDLLISSLAKTVAEQNIKISKIGGTN
ncbi:hypothetical protein SAMN02745163_04616 [Clostridium cavendishii DSM 21758]|uniref:Uncharacterized protein n=1 Tax=Clostridium cavendishii DSM 21758 TaxID=1121302 RepID=A0A1M6W747_9CLOT|nr:hypothetical protein [Clostridium cavendishii]SHK89468.1 hypothetical protein SAMN02745163_04616 [Clostridium cavendishii DSM 21758]